MRYKDSTPTDYQVRIQPGRRFSRTVTRSSGTVNLPWSGNPAHSLG